MPEFSSSYKLQQMQGRVAGDPHRRDHHHGNADSMRF
jgi:hypothetical protein